MAFDTQAQRQAAIGFGGAGAPAWTAGAGFDNEDCAVGLGTFALTGSGPPYNPPPASGRQISLQGRAFGRAFGWKWTMNI